MTFKLFALFCALLLTLGSAMQIDDEKSAKKCSAEISIFRK